MDDGYYVVCKSLLLESENQLSLYPFRLHRSRRKNEHKPVAPTKCCSDFVMPLLRSNDISSTVPNGKPMTTHHVRQLLDKVPITIRVREEYFLRQHEPLWGLVVK